MHSLAGIALGANSQVHLNSGSVAFDSPHVHELRLMRNPSCVLPRWLLED